MDRYFYEEAARGHYRLFDRRRNVSEPIAYGLDAELAQRIVDLLNADEAQKIGTPFERKLVSDGAVVRAMIGVAE